MKTILLLSLLMFSAIVTAQQLTGRVVQSETGTPVPFAVVYVVELSSGTQCDSLGVFRFDNFPSSPVTLKVSAAGYNTIEVRITGSTGEVLIVALPPAHVHLDEVIVSVPFGRLQHEHVTNVESRSVSELNRIPSTSLSEAISQIPGVYQSTNGLGIGKPVIRGLSGSRVVTYLNGLRIENQQWGGDHGMGVTDVGVDAVEVIKGPASLLFGSDALGGVLYFVDQPYARLNRYESYVKSRFESNTLGASNEAGLKWNRNGLKLNIIAGHTFHGDFRVPNGFFVRDTRFSTTTGKFSAGYNRRRWIGNLHYTFQNSFIGIPGHTHEDTLQPDLFFSTQPGWLKTLPYQHITNHYVSFENKFYLDRGTLELFVGNTSNHLREFEEKVTIPGIDLLLNNTYYNFRWKSGIGKKTEFIVGSQGMYQVNRNNEKAEEQLIPDNRSADAGAYTLLQFRLHELVIQVGSRYDLRHLQTDQPFEGFDILDKVYQSFNYSGGFAFRIDSLTIRANVSSGYRAPHTSELLSNGVHHGTFRYQKGDPGLRTENALQADFSAGIHFDHLELVINPFINRVENYIYLNPTDTVIDSYQVYQYTQADQALLYGGDVSVHLHPHFAHWLHVQTSLSIIYAEDHDGNPLPLIPQNRVNTQLKVEFPGSGNHRFSITDVIFQHSFYTRQNRVSAFETTTPGYHLIHLGLNLEIKTKGQPLLLTTGVKNLLNASYMDHLSRLKQIGLQQPGINFYLGLRYTFSGKISPKNQ